VASVGADFDGLECASGVTGEVSVCEHATRRKAFVKGVEGTLVPG